MTGRAGAVRPTPARVRTRHVAWLDERLSARDWRIVEEVNALRLVSGAQVERLCFAQLEGRSRTVTRSRVLARLVRWRVLVALERRIGGGSGRGSTSAVYALDTAGRQLLIRRQLAEAAPVRVRRPGTPGERSLSHMLAVSELYVQLVEATRADPTDRLTFRAEPGSWWPDGRGGRLKPDAYVCLERNGASDHWWIEADLATESLPTIRAKVKVYTDFDKRDGNGPGGVMPWVLIATVTPKRRAAIQTTLRRAGASGSDELEEDRNHDTEGEKIFSAQFEPESGLGATEDSSVVEANGRANGNSDTAGLVAVVELGDAAEYMIQRLHGP